MKMHLPHREIIEHATAVACIKEKLYHYRLHPASIMHGKVTLKNLDEIDANYGLLACALKYGKKTQHSCSMY